MATHLHQLLQSLCWNSEWNYAVFWKLKHQARMVLTWEDGYYNNQYKLDPSGRKSFSESPEGLQAGYLANDAVGLAVAKMSYHVYSLGEGVVGQVAVTGKHQWMFSGEHAMNSYSSSLELCNEWQAQFAAGIKTIVVAAVLPHGVVQFGSLNKVNENLQFLAHIRDAFSSLQESAFHTQTSMQCSLQHMLQTLDTSSRNVSANVRQDYLLEKAAATIPRPPPTKSYSLNDLVSANMNHISDSKASVPGVHHKEAVGLISTNGLPDSIGNAKLVLQSTDLLDPNYSIDSSIIRNIGVNNSNQICHPSNSSLTENTTLYNSILTGENIEVLPEFDCLRASETLNSSFMFSAGTELHEALGPVFMKQCYTFPSEVKNPEKGTTSQIPEAIESSMVTSNSSADHLLEAVVADFCHRDALKSRKSFSNSDSMMTTERMPEPSLSTSHTIGSSRYSLGCSSLLEESIQNCLNSSDSCGIRSSASASRERLVRSGEPGKSNKKRARPGENSRPRPRDRQLIQDRIKELRELVPNGSKCSIDSLLERTIKHMTFMQNVTKHSDKLSKCAKSKGCSEMGVIGSGNEQGSSWAVEVGGHMKICPILVENLNINGQMLIEMLCEDCDHFLEITEAIRSLGLTILKGITDSHGEKTWMRFVVEGQSNRNLHRMDVLWSLVQILQSKTTV